MDPGCNIACFFARRSCEISSNNDTWRNGEILVFRTCKGELEAYNTGCTRVTRLEVCSVEWRIVELSWGARNRFNRSPYGVKKKILVIGKAGLMYQSVLMKLRRKFN